MKLNPAAQHDEYAEHSSQWVKCRDCIDGEDVIHAKGESYLPKLSGQTDSDYKSYVMRTPFYNATARTIDGLVGMVFRKTPIIDIPASMDSFKLDMTLTNCDINELSEKITREVISIGRIGVLVERPQINIDGVTKAVEAALNLRPYATIYEADSILNWRLSRINNVMQPIMITLKECVNEWVSDFESKEIEQIRALLLIDGVYIQRLYRKNEKKEWDQFDNDIIPLMNNKPLSYIPFVFFGANSNNGEVKTPPLYDLVTLNLSHYRTAADLEHGAHFTGLPTAFVSGYQAGKDEKLSIGSSSAWVFPDPQAKASYLEFTGQGLGALENRLKAKEDAMAALGARMLAPEKAGVEAQGTLRMRHSGEGAVLSSITNMVSSGLKRVLVIMAEWSGINGDINVALNKDFIDNNLSAQEILALVQSWQAGALPKEELFYNLKNGEVIRPETTYDEYFGALETAMPAFGT